MNNHRQTPENQSTAEAQLHAMDMAISTQDRYDLLRSATATSRAEASQCLRQADRFQAFPHRLWRKGTVRRLEAKASRLTGSIMTTEKKVGAYYDAVLASRYSPLAEELYKEAKLLAQGWDDAPLEDELAAQQAMSVAEYAKIFPYDLSFGARGSREPKDQLTFANFVRLAALKAATPERTDQMTLGADFIDYEQELYEDVRRIGALCLLDSDSLPQTVRPQKKPDERIWTLPRYGVAAKLSLYSTCQYTEVDGGIDSLQSGTAALSFPPFFPVPYPRHR